MKIQSSNFTAAYAHLVREKQEGQSGFSREEKPPRNQDQGKSGDEDANSEPQNQSAEMVEEAVKAFQDDIQSQANGLTVGIVNEGPGLKVVLKDSQGGVIRQLSGEEFLRLREKLSTEGHQSGKILDLKR